MYQARQAHVYTRLCAAPDRSIKSQLYSEGTLQTTTHSSVLPRHKSLNMALCHSLSTWHNALGISQSFTAVSARHSLSAGPHSHLQCWEKHSLASLAGQQPRQPERSLLV